MQTEITKQLELLFGSIGVILGLFFSVFLLTNRKSQIKASFFLGIYLLTFSLRIGKSVFHYFYELSPEIRNFFIGILFCVGPSLWLYTRNLTRLQNPTRSRHDVLHYIPFLLIAPFSFFIPNNGPGTDTTLFTLFYNVIILHMFAYCVWSLVWFSRHQNQAQETDGATRITWLRYFLWVNLGFVVLYFLISQLIFPFYIGLSFLFSGIIIFFSVWALKNPSLFKMPKEKYENSSLNETRAKDIIRNLKSYLETEKAFLNPSLTLSQVSKHLEISTKDLSQAINQTEKLNYSQFIAQYRVAEAKKLLTSSKHKDFTIAAIAYDCGFNSISSFNTTFKKVAKITPLEFQKTALKQ
ncbi:MAG: helix-turn-helix domain-containing protein [Bacteroidota bacterium]